LADAKSIEINGIEINLKDAKARTDIETVKENQINLIEDDTSMEGISDSEHDTLETDNKKIIPAINEVNDKFKDIANLSLTKHSDGKVYIKKQDGTLIGDGIEIGGSDVDLSKITMSMSGQTLKLMNDGTQIATVEIPTAVVTDEQLTNIIQSKIDDGTLSALTVGDGTVTPNKTSFLIETQASTGVDEIEWKEGYSISNGNEFVNGNYKVTQYLPISFTKLTITCSSNTINSINLFDANKTFIQQINYSSYNKNTTVFENLDTYNATYFRFACAKTVTVELSSDEQSEGSFDFNTGYKEKFQKALNLPSFDNINRFKSKVMIVGGDSIVEKNSTATKVWHEYLAEWLGLTIHNDGQGGTGFAKNYYQRGSTIYRIENKWSTLYPANPDIILIMGNQNDGTGGGGGFIDIYPDGGDNAKNGVPPVVGEKTDDKTVFSEYGIVRRLLEDLIEKYPKAKIGMISSTPRDNDITKYWSNNPKSYGHGWYSDYVTAQKYVCEDLGIPFLDIYHQNPVLRPYNNTNVSTYYADGTEATGEATGAVHPNDLGHLYGIAIPVYNWMLTWL
jgi:hypothetical protein